MTRKRQKQYAWAAMRDQGLLDLRFCDLKLDLNTTALTRQTDRLYAELAPHGIAILFYLAHPHPAHLEFRQMYDVEAGTVRLCQRVSV